MTMKNYRIFVADDESLAIDSIKVLLSKIDDCELVGEASNGKDAFNQILELAPDIVFLDIQMPYITGIDVLSKLNRKGAPFFIMVTAFEDHALKAFELNAIDYLLKPYTDERFYQSLARAKEHVNMYNLEDKLEELTQLVQTTNTPKHYRDYFSIKSKGKIELLKVADISHISASGNYVEFVSGDMKRLSRTSLADIEKDLDPADFVRIHRSSIVKKSEIKELQNYFNGEFIVIMKNGDQLKLSRSFKGNLGF